MMMMMMTARTRQRWTVASQSTPLAKRRRCDADGVHDILDELLNSEESTSSAADSNMEDQVRSYLALTTISRHESLVSWWRENAKLYPEFAMFAHRFLSAPSTSVTRCLTGQAPSYLVDCQLVADVSVRRL